LLFKPCSAFYDRTRQEGRATLSQGMRKALKRRKPLKGGETEASVQDILPVALWNHRAGRLADAEACYRRALKLEPRHPEALHHLGMLHYQRGEAGAALDLMHRAVEASPEYAEAYSNMGVVLSGRGMLEEAIDCYQFAILIRPDYREAYHNLGGAFAERGEPEKAAACHSRALRLGRPGAGVGGPMKQGLSDETGA
jgi:tetratricopeptide (TPR) repeat protein